MKRSPFLLALFGLCIFISCSKSESTEKQLEEEQQQQEESINSRVYDLLEVGDSGVAGDIIFDKNEDGSTTVIIQLNGTSKDVLPARIYFNSLEEGGSIAITLESIDCACESSTSVITQLDDGTPFTFDNLVIFNGHINVHQNIDNVETIIAQGNIGSNGK